MPAPPARRPERARSGAVEGADADGDDEVVGRFAGSEHEVLPGDVADHHATRGDLVGRGGPARLMAVAERSLARMCPVLRRLGRGCDLQLVGHGRDERRPDDVSLQASVSDVAAVVERLQLAPVVLIGQSLGGLTALLVAARHPELVHALVVVDAGPADEPDSDDDWSRIRSPTLILRPGRGMLTRDDVSAMVTALPHAEVSEIDDAEHDVHLDRPQEWRAALRPFLDRTAPVSR